MIIQLLNIKDGISFDDDCNLVYEPGDKKIVYFSRGKKYSCVEVDNYSYLDKLIISADKTL